MTIGELVDILMKFKPDMEIVLAEQDDDGELREIDIGENDICEETDVNGRTRVLIY